jgi:hypothetical protein
MPSRKQRRRREKERRHEYEFIYLDEEGREIEVDSAELEDAAPRRNGKREPRREKQKGRSERPIRAVQPPSWRRVAKRGLLFFPLFFIVFSVLSKSQALATRFAYAAVYTLFLVPFMYLMDRTMYRAYLKRTGQAPPPQRAGRRR